MKKAIYTILTFTCIIFVWYQVSLTANPVVNNDTEEHRAMNRRTDVSFKIIEQ